MSFTSLSFFAIVIATIILYYIFPLKYRWYVLLASSCYFYVIAAGKRAFIVALITVALAYFSAIRMGECSEDKKKKKLILTVSVITIVGLLSMFKIKRYAAWDMSWLIVPLGVSYYTFSIVGYLVDVYSKKQPAETNYLKLLLYTLYFPKIMQGPISKFREIGPSLIEGHSFDYQQFCFGLQLIVWGYFKKLVISERATVISDAVFGSFDTYSNGGAILLIYTFIAVVGFYCDFSGYMDIVIGVSQMMGIKLEENFQQPFFSKSAAEFWRRWHITLGVWFKDYVYMALVASPAVIKISKWAKDHFGKRAGKAALSAIPLAIVWFLTGLWHGTEVNYILWGIYWGTIIIFSSIFAPELKRATQLLHINTAAADWKIFQMLRTFAIFSGGLLISTFVGASGIPAYIRVIVKDPGIGRLSLSRLSLSGLGRTDIAVLFISIMLLMVIEIIQTKGSVRERIAGLNGFTRWVIYAVGFLLVVLLGRYGAGYTTKGFAYTFF